MIFFYTHDPHGYFGGNEALSGSLINNMLDWRAGEYDAMIIGDSRMTAFDEEYVQRLNQNSGLRYKNMSYDGAMGEEMNTL